MSNIITKLYAQTDPRWANQLLGFNTSRPYTIGNYGCVVTAVGNLLYAITGNPMYTPAYINTWGKANGGFALGGGLVKWDAYLNLGSFTGHGQTSSLQEVNQWLQADENFVIPEFQLPGNQHYCMAPYIGMIIDSEDGNLKPMSTYRFLAARLYTASVPARPAAPVPSAPVAQPRSGSVTVTASPFLWLHTGPGTGYPHATGRDVNGNPIQSLPKGAVVEFVNVVQGEPVDGNPNWLVSKRGNYFSARYTTFA
jgi:hypothetical protein